MKNSTLRFKKAMNGRNQKTTLSMVFLPTQLKGLLLLLVMTVSSVFAFAQTTYYVNDGSNVGDVYTSATGNNANDGLSASTPKLTIAAAYALAVNGDIIMVDAGTYFESLNLSKRLTITGASSTLTTLTDANPCSFNSGTTGIQVNSSGTSLSDLRVTNFDRGIIVQTHSVTLTNVSSSSNCNFGITMALGANNIELSNCKFNNNTLTGIRVGTAHQLKNVLINNTEAMGNEIGISVSSSFSSGQKPNIFDSVTITNSNFSNNTKRGMYFEKLSNALIEGNIINNSGTLSTDSTNAGVDINVKQGNYANIIIRNNEITNCGSLGSATIPTKPCAMVIKGRDDGINGGTLDNVTVQNNYIHGPRNGLRIGEVNAFNAYPTNITITENTFQVGEAVDDLLNFTTNSNIPATCNWFGINNAASIASLVNGSFNYIPYLVNGTDNSGAVGFQPTPVTLTASAGPDKTTYFGYTLPYQTTTLTASASGGSGSYSYLWSPGGATTQSITVAPADTTTYTVTISDNNGCVTSNSDAATVNCQDVRCNNGLGGTVVICRWRLVGGVVTRTTECVAEKSVAKILIKGNLGRCDLLSKRSGNTYFENDLLVYPNPSTGIVSIGLPTMEEVNSIKLINSVGQVIYQTTSSESLLEIDLSSFPKGMYFVECVNSENSYFKKLILN